MLKLFFLVFITVLLTELGDKHTIATVLFASQYETNKLVIFLAASLALILGVGISIFFGHYITQYLNIKYVQYCAGILFIAIGLWTLIEA